MASTADSDATESASSEAKATTTRQRRGTYFPRMSLPDVVKAVRDIAAYGFQHSADSVAEHLGHTTSNSGPFKGKLASLKAYGVIEGPNDALRITALGQRMTHPDTTGPEASTVTLRDAFTKVEIFNDILNGLQPALDLKTEGIGNKAVRDLGVAPGSRSEFVDSFVAGGVAARLGERVNETTVRVVSKEHAAQPDTQETESQDLSSGWNEDARGGRGRTIARHEHAGTPIVHHVWELPNGEITFQVMVDSTLPAKAYGVIQEIVETGDKLAAQLGFGQDDNAPES